MPIFGFVHIVESPTDADLQARRAEGFVLNEALGIAQIPHWYTLVRTRDELRNALQEGIATAWHQLGAHLNPIVHLSVHGNAQGIQLNNGDFLTWHELRELLLPLLQAMQGRLLICMSSCFGAGGCRMAMYNDQHRPFWALVGHSRSPSWADAAISYVSFYHLFFKGFDIDTCVGSMKVASGDHNFVMFMGAQAQANWQALIANNPPINLSPLAPE